MNFERALRLMRSRDPQRAEDGFGMLRDIAGEHVGELVTQFERETHHGTRCWLLELIGETRSVEAFDLLARELLSEDESLRSWARRGLELLDTTEARRLLWQHRTRQPR